jgi:hypothetical protein
MNLFQNSNIVPWLCEIAQVFECHHFKNIILGANILQFEVFLTKVWHLHWVPPTQVVFAGLPQKPCWKKAHPHCIYHTGYSLFSSTRWLSSNFHFNGYIRYL